MLSYSATGLALLVICGAIAAQPRAAPTATPTEVHNRSSDASVSVRGLKYRDDTYSSLATASKVLKLGGSRTGQSYRYSRSSGGGDTILDGRAAVFALSNSRNSNPTYLAPCSVGSDATNPYPFSIDDADKTVVAGALIRGSVPQQSDWRPTYCNSAGIIMKDAPATTIDGVRIAGVWDAIRASSGSPNLVVKNSWVSDVRDDFLENDYLYPASVEDSLVDGVFQGISLKSSPTNLSDASDRLVQMTGVQMRIREYLYRGKMYFGAPTKNQPQSPRLQFRNSVIAVDYQGGRTWYNYWSTTWAKQSNSSNNLFLWLSDLPIPTDFPRPPSAFKIITGGSARAAWASARTNWINCHPQVVREAADTRSNAAACMGGTWGGFSN